MSAYNNYFPYGYPQYQTQYQQQYQQQYQPQTNQQNSSIIWVQGENAAKSYMIGAGQSVMLMDSDTNVFYIKSADQSGMPLPLRIFDYTERTAERSADQAQVSSQPVNSDYITRDEFERRIAEITSQSKKPVTTARKEKVDG